MPCQWWRNKQKRKLHPLAWGRTLSEFLRDQATSSSQLAAISHVPTPTFYVVLLVLADSNTQSTQQHLHQRKWLGSDNPPCLPPCSLWGSSTTVYKLRFDGSLSVQRRNNIILTWVTVAGKYVDTLRHLQSNLLRGWINISPQGWLMFEIIYFSSK